MKNFHARPLWAAACLMSLQLATPAVQAQTASTLPLSGPAFLIADSAYKAYASGNYALAIEQAREAVRLRPDVKSLRDFLEQAEAAQLAQLGATQAGPTGKANTATPTVRSRGGRQPSTVTSPAQANVAEVQPVDPAPGLAFTAATDGYAAYDARNYALAVEKARKAVSLQPSNQDYRLLLINALMAAGNGRDAEQALLEARALAIGDAKFAEKLEAQGAQLRKNEAQTLGASAYSRFEKSDFAAAAIDARGALRLEPINGDFQALLINSLFRSGQYAEAEDAATLALQQAQPSQANTLLQRKSALFAQRGFIRQKRGLDALAQQDFEAALAGGQLPASTEIGLLMDLGRQAEARQRFESASSNGELKALPDTELAYLAVRTGHDDQALAAFNRADAAGLLANTAYQDAAFAALRGRQDPQAIAYFKRAISDANALKLQMEPQLLFNTRRAVSEVSRQGGLIASLTYRGAVSGIGVGQGASADSVQGGIEGYWRPWGYQNGQYTELFARAFQTLYSDGGATGSATLQTAVGIRHKPLAAHNLVFSLARVISPSEGRNDWLAQAGYSADSGTDLRVDVASWWTRRAFVEVGRYFSASQTYALGELQVGKSFRLADGDKVGSGRWALFPHLSLAADYDSAALEQSAVGFGPGLTARYWFREDVDAAPRSYVDFSLHYRGRLSGAQRAKGVFLTTTVSY